MVSFQEKFPNKIFFRFESQYLWDISPSLIRNLNVKGDLDISYETLLKLYSENGFDGSLINKYKKFFAESSNTESFNIDYKFLAWMQHSVSYSP